MPPVYIYRSDKSSVEEHVFKGMPLGTMEKFPYAVESIELDKGDTILMMSDGFPELMNAGNEMFGFKRTRNLFEDIAEKDPEAIITELKNQGSHWADNNDPDDDVTFVVIRVK
jgi:serine phosphatase RsbU (regulator of sigma subunit)